MLIAGVMQYYSLNGPFQMKCEGDRTKKLRIWVEEATNSWLWSLKADVLAGDLMDFSDMFFLL